MRINRNQNNYNNQPNFQSLLVTSNGAAALKKAYSPTQLKLISAWKQELKNTKHFDLEISAVLDELCFTFKHHTKPQLNSEGPLSPHQVKGNQLYAYGAVDLGDCKDAFLYNNLKFRTPIDAAEAYRNLCEHREMCTPYRKNNIQRIRWAVDSTKILDNAAEYTGSEKIRHVGELVPENRALKPEKSTKASLLEQLKKAWQVLKGN